MTLSMSRPEGLRRLRPRALMIGCDGRLKAERVADRDDELADAQPRRAAKFGKGQAAGGKPQHGKIGRRVVADRHRLDLMPVGHRGDEPGRAGNDVVVGQQIAVGREHDTRADAAGPALWVDRSDMRDGGTDPLERGCDTRRIGIERVLAGSRVAGQNIKGHGT